MEKTRSPICSCLGHVDHGKSSILDKIRDSAIVATEAGKITQAIGASIIPIETIRKICGNLLDALNLNFTIPGILAIDTPGHAAFTNLRKRGGNLADIAIVVIDINEGMKPQTEEAIEILKSYKTPFIVAANKIDLLPGWKTQSPNLIQNISSQEASVQQKIDTKLYELVGQFHEKFELNAERFDRVDYTKQIALIPTSAETGEGIPELLMVLSGLAQKFLEQSLKCDVSGLAKGTILEVKEERGLGTTLDVILYGGTLRVNDTIIIGSIGEPIVTKVRALFEPKPLSEMRDKKSKFNSVKEAIAATGVKISAPDIGQALSGAPIVAVTDDTIEESKEQIQKEIEDVLIETDKDGIIIKADSLGSLEALITLLKEKDIMIKKASVGDISKKDVTEAESSLEENPADCVILGFNVKVQPDVVQNDNVKIITDDVVYKLIENFEKFQDELKKKQEEEEAKNLPKPCKVQIKPGYVFRQNNPAVVGVDVIAGTLTTGVSLMKNDGHELTTVKTIQHEKESTQKAEKGKAVAVSLDRVTVGRQIHENDILISVISEKEFRLLKDFKKYLDEDEKEILKEIAEMHRKENPVWGV